MGKIRDITFDIAKGIGIVLVVIGHYIPDILWIPPFVVYRICKFCLSFPHASFFYDRWFFL